MATKRNIYIDQGSTFEIDVDVLLANGGTFALNNYSSRASFRKHYESNTAYTITTAMNVVGGYITLTFPSTLTAPIDSGKYVYDVEIYNGNTVFRTLEGTLFIAPEVTK